MLINSFISKGNGSGDIITEVYYETKVANMDGQTNFTIDLLSFDPNIDAIEVYSGRTRLSPLLDYTISGNTVILGEGVPEGRTIDFSILHRMLVTDEEVMFSGA